MPIISELPFRVYPSEFYLVHIIFPGRKQPYRGGEKGTPGYAFCTWPCYYRKEIIARSINNLVILYFNRYLESSKRNSVMNIQHQTITTCWQYVTQSENHQIKSTINIYIFGIRNISTRMGNEMHFNNRKSHRLCDGSSQMRRGYCVGNNENRETKAGFTH